MYVQSHSSFLVLKAELENDEHLWLCCPSPQDPELQGTHNPLQGSSGLSWGGVRSPHILLQQSGVGGKLLPGQMEELAGAGLAQCLGSTDVGLILHRDARSYPSAVVKGEV